MRSNAYNIVLTKDPIVTEKLFYDKFNRTNFYERLQALSEEESSESLIVSPLKNNNFISFEIDFPSAQQQRYCVLRLVENEKLLEYFMLSRSGAEELIKLHARSVRTVGGNSALIDAAAKIKPTFYVSYGVGDNISEWAGPFAVELIDANLSITSDGVRQLELMFSPTVEGQLVFTNKLFNDTNITQKGSIFHSQINNASRDKLSIAYSLPYSIGEIRGEKTNIETNRKSSYVLKHKNYLYNDASKTPTTITTNPLGGVIRTPGIDANKPTEFNGFNYVLRDIVKEYLSKLFNIPKDNVLFFCDFDFSKIDSLLKGGVLGDVRPINKELKKFGMSCSQPFIDPRIRYNSDYIKKNVQNFIDLLGDLKAKSDQGLKRIKNERDYKKSVADLNRYLKDRVQKNNLRSLKVIYELQYQLLKLTKQYNNSSNRQGADLDILEKYGIKPDGSTINAEDLPSNRPGPWRSAAGKSIPELNREMIARRKTIPDIIENINKNYFPNDRLQARGLLDSLKNAYAEADDLDLDAKFVKQQRDQLRIKYSTNNRSTLFVLDEDRDDYLRLRRKPLTFNYDKLVEGIDRFADSKLYFKFDNPTTVSDVSDSELFALKFLGNLTRGIVESDKGSVFNDYVINEENNFKILKLLEKHNLIETSKQPVILFGRQPIINSIIYPTNLQKLDFDLYNIFYEMKSSFLQFARPQVDILAGPYAEDYQDYETNRVLKSVDDYRVDFLSTFTDVIQAKTSSFNESMDFGPYNSEALLTINSLKGPLVFMHNTKNSNVLDISFDTSPYKGVLMNMGSDSSFKLLDYALDSEQVVADNSIFSKKLNKLIDTLAREKKRFDKSNASKNTSFLTHIRKSNKVRILLLEMLSQTDLERIKKETRNQAGVFGFFGEDKLKNVNEDRDIDAETLTVYQQTDITHLLNFVLLKASTRPSFSKRTSNTLKSEVETIKNILQYVINVKVKTLPFFNVTTFMGRDCYLFGIPNNIIGSNTVRDIPTPSFFTGDFTIIGFKHTITYDNAYSEFELVPGPLKEGFVTASQNTINFFDISIQDALDYRLKSNSGIRRAYESTEEYQNFSKEVSLPRGFKG